MNRLTIVELLIILRAFRKAIKRAFPGMFPDLDDPRQVYTWTRNAVTLAANLARLTPTKIDDAVAAWLLANVLASEAQFEPYYQIFRAIYEAIRRGDSDSVIAAHVLDTASPAELERLLPAHAVPSPTGAPFERIIILITVLRLLITLLSDAEPEPQQVQAGGE